MDGAHEAIKMPRFLAVCRLAQIRNDQTVISLSDWFMTLEARLTHGSFDMPIIFADRRMPGFTEPFHQTAVPVGGGGGEFVPLK
jgi:hypothetical protein